MSSFLPSILTARVICKAEKQRILNGYFYKENYKKILHSQRADLACYVSKSQADPFLTLW